MPLSFKKNPLCWHKLCFSADAEQLVLLDCGAVAEQLEASNPGFVDIISCIVIVDKKRANFRGGVVI